MTEGHKRARREMYLETGGMPKPQVDSRGRGLPQFEIILHNPNILNI